MDVSTRLNNYLYEEFLYMAMVLNVIFLCVCRSVCPPLISFELSVSNLTQHF
jgi:hypothetical protein